MDREPLACIANGVVTGAGIGGAASLYVASDATGRRPKDKRCTRMICLRPCITRWALLRIGSASTSESAERVVKGGNKRPRGRRFVGGGRSPADGANALDVVEGVWSGSATEGYAPATKATRDQTSWRGLGWRRLNSSRISAVVAFAGLDFNVQQLTVGRGIKSQTFVVWPLLARLGDSRAVFRQNQPPN